MNKKKIFVACDSINISKIKEIIRKTENSKLEVGYKFGLEFLNSKDGRKFISKLKNKITFGDYKFADIPNTCASAVKAVKDLNFNYLTIHINSGLEALKAAKKAAGNSKLIGVTILTSLDNKSLKEVASFASIAPAKLTFPAPDDPVSIVVVPLLLKLTPEVLNLIF